MSWYVRIMPARDAWSKRCETNLFIYINRGLGTPQTLVTKCPRA